MSQFNFVSGLVDAQFIEAIQAHPVASQHYNAIVGSAQPLVAVPVDEDSVSAHDVPQMSLVAESLSVSGASPFLLGDLYVGHVEGRPALAFHWDFTGLFIITA